MASASSSSSIMVSSGPNPSRYDVFLSFRGKDTRDRFTDHLYHALRREGINPFRDDNDFSDGQELKPEIERGIKESKASIVVLSENYADSTWCLDELCLILKQKKDCNYFVPVFYDVEPSDVRKHLKTFAIKAKPSTSGRWTEDNVTRWKASLEEVGSLKGKVASGYRPETKLLAVIVDAIKENVDLNQHSLPPNLIGMDTQVKYINSWLMESDDELFALYGMGGSGKTTLASYIFHSNCRKFQSTSFVENIGIRCKEHDRLEGLQEQLLNDILGGKNNKITNVGLGKSKIKEALQMKRALIVLDDIDELEQLEALLGTGEIKTQSKIMITTRIYKDEWFRSRSWRCRRYKMKLLGNDESLELLSLHAFHSKIPKEGFKDLAEQAIRYCDGNPLALEVLGSNLYEKNTIPLWKSELSFLEREINFKIQRVLVRSYNSLSSRNDKELFLHIACFFVGKDRDYVVKILEPDYSALSRIKTLIDKNLLSVSPNNKLIMHRLIQEMGRTIVLEESPKDPAKRSRIWHSKDSYDVLEKGEGSNTVEGLALNMQMLREEKYAFEPSDIKAESLKNMDKLKLLHLKYVQLTGSYKNFSKDLRWFCWIGFNLQTMPSDLFMRNLVAMDMSYSKLEVFELPEVLQFLKILNLRDSLDLLQIRNLSRLPDLETLILWNCHRLVHVCETIKDLKSLTLLNMIACENLFKMKFFDQIKLQVTSTFFGGSTQQHSFSLPRSLKWLFLKDCHLKLTDYFPLSFSKQLCLQYLDLGNSLFESLPDYRHLENLRVLDLSFCSKLKELLSLPSTLAELFTYYCESLEKITFQSHRFTLQEVGYAGCINLSEIQGFIKLVPIAKLDETDVGHMKWLREYENKEVCLAGDDELTIGRSRHAQMLYEFNIMSTSLPDIKDPNMRPDCISKSPLLSFDVPVCPKKRRLKGLNVSFKYTISGEDLVWFSKIRTANGVDLMYNPKVFGKPGTGEVGIWLSYWPIGNRLNAGDKVNVSICVLSGLEVLECGASLVYTDDEETEETSKNNMDWVGLSGFQLSTGGYYLCRRDFFELMEVDRLTRDWFKILVDGTIDDTEIQGWRKTGRPQQFHPSDTELKAVRCIIHGPESEEIYKIAKMSKSSFVDSMELISSTLGEAMKSATTSKFSDAATKPVGTVIIPEASVIDEIMGLASSSPKDEMESSSEFSTLTTKETTTFGIFR